MLNHLKPLCAMVLLLLLPWPWGAGKDKQRVSFPVCRDCNLRKILVVHSEQPGNLLVRKPPFLRFLHRLDFWGWKVSSAFQLVLLASYFWPEHISDYMSWYCRPNCDSLCICGCSSEESNGGDSQAGWRKLCFLGWPRRVQHSPEHQPAPWAGQPGCLHAHGKPAEWD